MEGSSSIFALHLDTNYAATEEEIPQIRKHLHDTMSRLNSLQKCIDVVAVHRNALQNEHANLSREIEDHHALMAPIRRLPAILIQKIFLECLPKTHNAIISSRDCPVLLGQICSHWRHIALSTEALWTSIHIPIPTKTVIGRQYGWQQIATASDTAPMVAKAQKRGLTAMVQKRARAISEWLSRSGTLSLSISLYNPPDSKPAKIYDIILDALIPFANRWGNVEFLAPGARLSRVITLPSNSFPNLHSVTIYGNINMEYLQPVLWRDSGILCAPQLRNLRYIHVTEDVALFPLRWAQLTSLSVYHGVTWPPSAGMSVEKCTSILSACPLLVYCRLEVTGVAGSVSSASHEGINYPITSLDLNAPTSIALPHLLQFHLEADTSIASLMHLLDTPMLQILEFHSSNPEPSPLPAFLQQVAHTLRMLTVDPRLFTYDEFMACIRTCSGITELAIKGGTTRTSRWWSGDFNLAETMLMDDRLLEILTPQNEAVAEEALLPKLSKFSCNSESPMMSDSAVLEFIQARNKKHSGVERLKIVDFAFTRPQHLPMKAALDELAEDDVTCRLSYYPRLGRGPFSAWDGINKRRTNLQVPWGGSIGPLL